jgi:phytoene dehydrogenase-like protein
MTNYVPAGTKGTPLGRLLRQLRIEREELALCPQKQSRVVFGAGGGAGLRFTNDRAVLEQEIAEKFPRQIDGFRRLATSLGIYDELAADSSGASARAVVRRHIADPLLEDLLFCPLMYYGSASERDMDYAQFGIMFRSIYLEGLARPFEGIRPIIRVLLDKFRVAGGERRMNCGVARLVERGGRVAAVMLDDGSEITADHVISSIGADETRALLRAAPYGTGAPAVEGERRLSFVETIRDRFDYAVPAEPVDLRSGVICIPNNFDYGGRDLPEGLVRVTCLANYAAWAALPEPDYRAAKARWLGAMTASAGRFLLPVTEAALDAATVATDMFTPRTITHFTGHWQGAVYGSPCKVRDGGTGLANLHLCGTDQGMLGIVGSMLSGIAAANRHVLQAAARA